MKNESPKDKIIRQKVESALEQTAKDEAAFEKLPNKGGIFRPSKEQIFQQNLKKQFLKKEDDERSR